MTDGGTFRVDAHVKVLDERVVARAKERGLDAIVYAPHFTRLPQIRERAERFSDDELLVVPAREVFTGRWYNRKHLLALDLDEPVPDFITLEAAFEELQRQDATIIVPHPAYLSIGLPTADIREYVDDIHALETTNAKLFPWHERRNKRLVEELSVPPFASSYGHLRRSVGSAWTEFDGDIEDEADLVAAFREGRSRRASRLQGLAFERIRAAELAHVVYENTYIKADRFFLSGTEPTHPRHIAYDGAFDDVAVY